MVSLVSNQSCSPRTQTCSLGFRRVLKSLSLYRQWAAVTIHLSATRVPPHMLSVSMPSNTWIIPAIQGNSLTPALTPFTILLDDLLIPHLQEALSASAAGAEGSAWAPTAKRHRRANILKLIVDLL